LPDQSIRIHWFPNCNRGLLGLVRHRDCDFSPRALTGSALLALRHCAGLPHSSCAQPSPLPSADWRGPVAARCGVPGVKGLHVRLRHSPRRSRARRVANDRAGFGLRPVALGAFFPGGGGSFTPARSPWKVRWRSPAWPSVLRAFPRVRIRSLRARTPPPASRGISSWELN